MPEAKCEKCGSIEFMIINIANVSGFYANEYQNNKFKITRPNFTLPDAEQKLVCVGCGKFLNEDRIIFNGDLQG